ncbi:MAG TPA: hypothetical protein PKE66_02570 [Pyrinomonadaceae bacterium]|nr:hypothetical protein [Pyrinomonadaceae bacterium]
MWDKFFGAIKDFILAGELTRLNTSDVRELRKQNENLTVLVERLAFEIQRVKENEAHEREKLMLKLGLHETPPRKTATKRLPKRSKK